MNQEWTAAIGVAGTLLGVSVGAALNYWTTKALKSREIQAAVRKDQAEAKRKVYAAFFAEVHRLIAVICRQPAADLKELDPLCMHYAEVRLVGSPTACEEARRIMDAMTNGFMAGADLDPARFRQQLMDFIEAARTDTLSQGAATKEWPAVR